MQRQLKTRDLKRRIINFYVENETGSGQNSEIFADIFSSNRCKQNLIIRLFPAELRQTLSYRNVSLNSSQLIDRKLSPTGK